MAHFLNEYKLKRKKHLRRNSISKSFVLRKIFYFIFCAIMCTVGSLSTFYPETKILCYQVSRTKKSERNSETGVDRMAIGHHIRKFKNVTDN